MIRPPIIKTPGDGDYAAHFPRTALCFWCREKGPNYPIFSHIARRIVPSCRVCADVVLNHGEPDPDEMVTKTFTSQEDR